MTSTSPTAASPRPTSRRSRASRQGRQGHRRRRHRDPLHRLQRRRRSRSTTLAVRKAIAQIIDRDAIAEHDLQGHGQAAVLDGSGRAPGRQGVLQGRLRRSGSGQGQGASSRRPASQTPVDARRLVHADPLRAGRGRSLERDQASARGERPVQGQARLDRVGPVQGRGLRQGHVLLLRPRLVPGLPGRRQLPRAVLRDGGFFQNGYSNKDVNDALDKELASDDEAERTEAFGVVQDTRRPRTFR